MTNRKPAGGRPLRPTREPSDETVRAALDAIPPNLEREEWVRVAMALKSFYGDAGFDVFDGWSRGAESYSARDARAVWRGLKQGGRIKVGTLLGIAKTHGFDVAAQYDRERAAERVMTGPSLPVQDDAARDRAEAEQRARDEAAQLAREREQADAAIVARERWESASRTGVAPYLVRKGVGLHGGRVEPDGTLLVPMFDADGVLWSVQTVDASGEKRFPKGGRVKGLHCWIGDPSGADVLLLAEGFATAATLHEASGRPVAVAFNAGNLVDVAAQLRTRFDGVRWIVAADDDRETQQRTGRNPGVDAARRAAAVLGAVVAIPQELPDGGTDFNDQAAAHGPDSVAAVVWAALDAPHGDGPPEVDMVPGDAQEAGALPPTEDPEQEPGGGKPWPPRPRKGQRRRSAAELDGHDTRGNPFEVAPDGVYYANTEGLRSRLCGPIEVVGESRNMDGFGWGKLVRFTNRDGERREWILPAELFAGDGVELRKVLASLGLWITPKNAVRARLTEYFESHQVTGRVRTVSVTGWSGKVFVMPGETIGAGDEPVVYHAPGDPGVKLETRGELDAWRDEVASLCVGNSRLVFALSLAFAAPLLALSGEKNGGFHLRGTSQDGKTTALQAAASVYSSPAYVRKWRSTDNAIEAVAALHSDLPLLLDELHQCSPKLVGDVAYLLAEGQGKARGERAGGLRQILRWRSLFLSTGETGLAEYMATADVRMTAGQEMRVAEIPAAPEGGHGVFEDLHGEPGGEAFALRLRDAVGAQYGTAGRAWIEWVVERFDAVSEHAHRQVMELSRDWCPSDSAGQVMSVARRFALVAVAGELATRAGVTGWRRGEATRAARACFEAWIDVRGGVGRSEERELLRRVRSFLQANEHRFEWWERAHDDRAPKTLNRAGFRKRYYKGQAIESDADAHVAFGEGAATAEVGEQITVDFYVFTEPMRREIFGEVDARFAHRVLIDRGIVKTEKNGTTLRPYRREWLPGHGRGSKQSVYVITSDGRARLEDALAAMGG